MKGHAWFNDIYNLLGKILIPSELGDTQIWYSSRSLGEKTGEILLNMGPGNNCSQNRCLQEWWVLVLGLPASKHPLHQYEHLTFAGNVGIASVACRCEWCAAAKTSIYYYITLAI